jgi:3'(2'), 5'-bisphosphate nucleotidase
MNPKDCGAADLAAMVPALLALCQRAGERICHHYARPGQTEVQSKVDDSPLTQADLDAHHLLLQGLDALTPRLPVLSEESPAGHKAQRRQWSRLWLVDPLDGTKEFVARSGEFTINIALIDAHRPVLGVLYHPLEQFAWVGLPGTFCRCYRWRDGRWQWSDIRVRPLSRQRPLTVLASRRHSGARLAACLDWLELHWGEIARRNSGSALKFGQLAQGDGDFYPRFSPCCEWDTAAGQAVLEAAGGALLGLDGKPLRYNARNTLMSPNFYAIGDPGHALWEALLRRR